jgi:hypothetical protein
MTCALALEALLDADPSEFGHAATSPLADHLRVCARCRRVAAQLDQDTQQLAVAMVSSHARWRSRGVRQLVLMPALALGAVVLAVAIRSEGRIAPRPQSAVQRVAAVPTPQAPVAEVPVQAPMPNAARAHRSMAPSIRREPQAFARAVPVPATRLARTEPVAAAGPLLAAGVAVTPPAGTRAAIMHTSDPKLVVVWLY